MEDILVDNLPCAVCCFADNGTINFANKTLSDLCGYNREELLHTNIESIFTLPTRIFFQTHFFPLLKLQGHAEEIFITLRKKSAEAFPVLLNAVRVNSDEPYTICAFIHIPNRKIFEDELVAARKKAQTALKENTQLVIVQKALEERAIQLEEQLTLGQNQNKDLLQLNHALTHNLKEPLRKILIFADRIHTDAQSAQLPQNLEKLLKATTQLNGIVSSLQQYAWLINARVAYSHVDLELLIQEVYKELSERFGDIKINCKINLPYHIEADRSQLRLLFEQLLINAVQFRSSKDSANIGVYGTVVKENSFRLVADKYRYEDYIKIKVRDEGCGFEPESKHKIFELFQTLHPNSGPGVGLALCTKVADNHVGYIVAETVANSYTEMTVSLPLRQHNEMPTSLHHS